jgi:hypothetical protein
MHQNTALSLSWQQCKDSHKVEQAVLNSQGYTQSKLTESSIKARSWYIYSRTSYSVASDWALSSHAPKHLPKGPICVSLSSRPLTVIPVSLAKPMQ